MLTLFYILISLNVLLIMLLAVPIDIEYEFNNRLEKKSRTRIIWLFGLINVELKESANDFDIEFEKPKKKRLNKIKKKRRSKSKSGIKPILAALKSEGFLRRTLKFLKDIFNIAEIKNLQAKLSFGLGDPADTGQLYGLMSPVFAFLYAVPRVNVSFTPIFDRATLDAEINAALRIVPIRFFRAIFRFIVSKEFFRAIKSAYKVYKS